MKEEILKNKFSACKCPFRMLMDHFGNKWSMIIIFALSKKDKMRFNELDKSIEGISPKVLASTLRSLENDLFISRKVYPEVPPRVEYSLTKMGQSILPVIEELVEWSYSYQDEIWEIWEKRSKTL